MTVGSAVNEFHREENRKTTLPVKLMQTMHSLNKWSRAWLQRVLVPRINSLLAFTDSKVNLIDRFRPGLEISRLSLHLPNLDSTFDGYQIIQISDLHLDYWMTETLLSETCRMVSSEKPDCVVITGDFFTVCAGRHDPPTTSKDILSRMASRQPTFAVLGNHDFEFDADFVRGYLQECGITVLANAVHTIEKDGAHLHIAGLDSIWSDEGRIDLTLERLPETGAAILLVHEPDYAVTSALTGRFDLQLSGHSHGGQIALPFLDLMGKTYLSVIFPQGLYRVGNMLQYTNRGIGVAHLPLRINCPPEITIISLQSH